MLVPVHRAERVTKATSMTWSTADTARVQHGVLRSKHWFAPVATAVAAYAMLWGFINPNAWMWG